MVPLQAAPLTWRSATAIFNSLPGTLTEPSHVPAGDTGCATATTLVPAQPAVRIPALIARVSATLILA